MPHHFRTIEAFVQLLEQRQSEQQALIDTAPNDYIRGIHTGARTAFQNVLATVRTSNIGIVYPPPEGEQ